MSDKPISIEEGWTKINEKGILPLQQYLDTKQGIPFTRQQYMNLYTMIYDICLQRNNTYSAQLYRKYTDSIGDYLIEKVVPILKTNKEKEPLVFLKVLHEQWENHNIVLNWMQKLFQYLDRYFVEQEGVLSLKRVGLELFKNQVYDKIKEEITQALLKMLQMEREGEFIEKELIRNCISIYIIIGPQKKKKTALQLYQSDFEKYFLDASKEYYERIANDWISNESTSDYLIKCKHCLTQENHMAQKYLDSSSAHKLNTLFNDTIVKKHFQTILSRPNGFINFLVQERVEDLERMYQLFQRLPETLAAMGATMRTQIEEEGDSIYQGLQRIFKQLIKGEQEKKLLKQLSNATPSTNDEEEKQGEIEIKGKEVIQKSTFIEDLLKLRDKYLLILEKCFNNDTIMKVCYNGAMEKILSKECEVNIAEILCCYCDKALRNGGKKTEKDLEYDLEGVAHLFSFITDKDYFILAYRQLLAKRLLLELSTSNEAEKGMISKIKMICGHNFTANIEGMMSDLVIADEVNPKFEEWLSENDIQAPIEFQVKVLTSSCWPTYQKTLIKIPAIPPQITSLVVSFEKFYHQAYSHRIIKWSLQNGFLILNSHCYNQIYQLRCTTYQGLVLLMFNNKDELTLQEIMEALQLNPDFTKRILHSITLMKNKLLDKSPNNKQFELDDTFTLNLKFKSITRKVKLAIPTQPEKLNLNKVSTDRTIAIEAAIVRIMKARKTMIHNELMQEVLSQLASFKPDPKIIKMKIEQLIERDYMERDSEDHTLYKYLA